MNQHSGTCWNFQKTCTIRSVLIFGVRDESTHSSDALLHIYCVLNAVITKAVRIVKSVVLSLQSHEKQCRKISQTEVSPDGKREKGCLLSLLGLKGDFKVSDR